MEQNSEGKAVKDILAGLRSRRPDDQPSAEVSLEQKVANITGVDFESRETEKAASVGESKPEEGNKGVNFEKMADAVFQAKVQKDLAEIQKNIELSQRMGFGNDQQKAEGELERKEKLYSLLGSAGKELLRKYVSDKLEAGSDGTDQEARIGQSIDEFCKKFDEFVKAIAQRSFDLERLYHLLSVKGMQKEDVNRYDISELEYISFRRNGNGGYLAAIKMLESLLAQNQPAIGKILDASDISYAYAYGREKEAGDLRVAAEHFFSEVVFAEYSRIAVDLPEREKQRKLYVAESFIKEKENFDLINFYEWDTSRLYDFFVSLVKEKSLPADQDFSEKAMASLKTYPKVDVVAEAIIERGGEKLLKKSGVNYEISDPEKFKVLMIEYEKNKAEEIIREVIAQYRPEEKMEILYLPEQRRAIDIMLKKMDDYGQYVHDQYKSEGEERFLTPNVLGGRMEDYALRMIETVCNQGYFKIEQWRELLDLLMR